MNIYGLRAQEHWEKYAPSRVEEMEDPDEFFETLGESAAQQIADLSERMERAETAPKGYLERVAHLNGIRKQAEEVVLADLIYSVQPEPEGPLDELIGLEGQLPNAEMLLDVVDRVHEMVAEQDEMNRRDPTYSPPATRTVFYSPEEKAQIKMCHQLREILLVPWSESDPAGMERRIEALRPFLDPQTQAMKTYL